MKQYICVFLLLSFRCAFSQELILPFRSASFGLHNHTNRDKSYFSNLDYQGNIIVTAITDNDSTFTDLLTTKFDPSLKVIWQTKTSIDTKLSIDFPLKTFVNKANDVYTTGVSIASNASEFNGVLFVVKHDTNGVLKWQINFEDLKNPINYNYTYQNSFLDGKDILHFVYSVENASNSELTFHFYSINQNGVILEKFARTDIADDFKNFTGLNFDFVVKENIFYLKFKRENSISYNKEYYLKKVSSDNLEIFNLTAHLPLNDNYDYGHEEIRFDSNNNVYLFYTNSSDKKFRFIKTNTSGHVLYAVSSPVDYKYLRVLEFFNKNGNYCVLSNRTSKSGSDLVELNLIEYNNEGNEINNTVVRNTYANHAKRYDDNTILVLMDDGSFKLFDESLKLISEFKGSQRTINDYCKIDNTTIITAETSFDKMFLTSDYVSKLDIHVNKINLSGIQNTYSYSGKGTSMSYYSRLIVDSRNNYYVTRKEDFGESNYGLGGTLAPQKFYLDKYNTDLKLLWSIEIPRIQTHLYETKLLVDSKDNVFIYGDVSSTEQELIKVSNQGQIIFQIPSFPKKEIYFDKDNNLELATGPAINFSSGEIITTIYTFDSENGILLNKKQFPSPEVFWGVFLSKDLNSYLYMYSKDYRNYSSHPKLYIYKNKVLQSVTNLDFSESDGDPYNFSIDKNGTLFFTTDYTKRLHRVTLDKQYSFISVADRITKISITPSNKVFAADSKENIKIYNDDLSLFAIRDHDLDYFRFNSVLNWGNNLLVNYIGGVNDPNLFKVFDEKLNVLNFFKINEITPGGYYQFDANNDFITIGGKGNNFRNYFDYRWSRSYIHKHKIDINSLDINKFERKTDQLLLYPNPTNSLMTILATDSDSIQMVKVYNISGQLIKTFYTSTIDLSNLDPAMYLLKVFTRTGKVIDEKIIRY
jgi:hypothetical protein